MSLKEQIGRDLKEALKAQKPIEVGTLRMLSAAIFNKEKEKRYSLTKEKPDLSEQDLEKESELIDQETMDVVSSELKKRREAISEFEKGEREDLVEKEKKEAEVLKKYLPRQLSPEEIKKLAQEIIKEVGAAEPKDMGRVMAQLMSKVKGRAEGSEVSKIVQELLKND